MTVEYIAKYIAAERQIGNIAGQVCLRFDKHTGQLQLAARYSRPDSGYETLDMLMLTVPIDSRCSDYELAELLAAKAKAKGIVIPEFTIDGDDDYAY